MNLFQSLVHSDANCFNKDEIDSVTCITATINSDYTEGNIHGEKSATYFSCYWLNAKAALNGSLCVFFSTLLVSAAAAQTQV